MQTTCSFGHIYDSDQYPSCPYCNRGSRAIFFGSNDNQTVMPGDQGSYDKTVAPGGFMYQQDDGIGETVMPDDLAKRMKKKEESKTVAIFKKKYGLDPVVGWLVCVEGEEKGQDYRLFNRINTIGRDESNDVVITFDRTVSQKNHVKLAYDEKHNNFQMIPGDGHNITYLNEQPLYVPQLLNPYDVIEFGETKLMFIPFCTEKFKWGQEAK